MLKILIVEDELLIQKSLQKLLEKRGNAVFTASSGKDAIELIRNNEFDRIVCDLMLQDITGFDVIEESKYKYSLEDIQKKFVIMTAYSSNQVLNKASTYNCSILKKPFENINDALDIFMGIKNES